MFSLALSFALAPDALALALGTFGSKMLYLALSFKKL
jgi:hypothetical protein